MISNNEAAYGNEETQDSERMTDLDRDIARLLGDKPDAGLNEKELLMMNEMFEEEAQREMSDIDSAPPPPPKVRLDESLESDFDSEFRRLKNEFDEDSPFERGYVLDDPMTEELNGHEVDGYENKDYARRLDQDMNADSLSDLGLMSNLDDEEQRSYGSFLNTMFGRGEEGSDTESDGGDDVSESDGDGMESDGTESDTIGESSEGDEDDTESDGDGGPEKRGLDEGAREVLRRLLETLIERRKMRS